MTALCRKSSEELSRIGVTVVEGVDVADPASFPEVEPIDWLIANAGIWRTENLQSLNFETMLEQFRSVTADEVRAVAQKYFTPASQTRAELIPQKLAAAPAADATPQPAPLDATGSEATVH